MTREYDIIVVGGGISGATCVSELSKRLSKGQSVLLLEARDRFGGRNCTEQVDNQIFDTGGQWLGSCHAKMLSLCQELGLEFEDQSFPSVDEGEPVNLIELAFYKLKTVEFAANQQIEKFQNFCRDSYLRMVSLSPDKADKMALEEDMIHWDKTSMFDMISSMCDHPEAIEQLSFFTQTVLSIDPTQCSFIFFLHYVYVWGGGEKGMELLGDGPHGLQAIKVRGGCQQISEKLVEAALKSIQVSCEAIRNCAVHAIEYDVDSDKILITARECKSKSNANTNTNTNTNANITTVINDNYLDGRVDEGTESIIRYQCRRLVLAMPPNLINKAISFAPPELVSQNEKRWALYNKMHMGSVCKVIFIFQEPFWRQQHQKNKNQNNQSSGNNMSISEIGLVSNIFESKEDGHRMPALVCLITGKYAQLYSSLCKEERIDRVLTQLQNMYGDVYKPPLHYIEKDWISEMYSGGGFACCVAPSEEALFVTHGRLLREPILRGKIFVAGTEASTRFYGYMEGGARRGEEVAIEIAHLEDMQDIPDIQDIQDMKEDEE